MSIQTYWTSQIKPCTDPDHKSFTYWRSGEQQYMCDLCNWDTAWRGGPGWIRAYPQGVQEVLRRELAAQGIDIRE
jgi:hypothetical protein